jgi:hypothetical protein
MLSSAGLRPELRRVKAESFSDFRAPSARLASRSFRTNLDFPF